MNESPVYHLTLADGRNLSYTDIGSGENGTWIHCHGIPGSRNELMHLSDELRNAGIRLVVPDRPGYGHSTQNPAFGFASHSDDLRQLADHLQLPRFALSGFSGGGVFALATTHDLGRRVNRLTIAATPAVPLMDDPFEYASTLTASSWRAAQENPDELASALEALTGSTEALAGALLDAVGDEERQYLVSEPVYQGFHTSLRTALEQGAATAAKALARDTSLAAHPMAFQLDELEPPVQVLHGTDDKLVYGEHQVALLNHLPNARSRLVAGVGHYDLLSLIWS